jgi:CheY-like chemotaxis protein
MNRRSVLVVDDDARSLKLLRDILEHHAYEVRTATSGEEACSIVTQGFVPGLVLMDVHLPGMDGIETITVLRSMPEMAGVRYVAVTASVMPAQVAALDAAGIPLHPKPIDRERLVSEVEGLLGRR